MAEKLFGVHEHFAKNEYNLFYHELVAKYYHVKQVLREKQYFLMKLQKTFLEGAFDHFLGKGDVLRQKLI